MSLLSHAFAEGTLEYWLCPREALESLLASDPELAGEQLRLLREAVAAADGDAEQVRDRLHVNVGEPLEGADWWPWFRWVESRLIEVSTDPDSVHPEVVQPADYPWRLRESRFTGATAKRAAALDVVEGNGAEVRAWLAAAAPAPTRWRVVGEVSALVGEAVELSWDPYDRFSSGVSTVVSSRAVGVALRRGAGPAEFKVASVDVVDAADEEGADQVRSRFPLLHALLGGWFGDEEVRDQHPWDVQRAMLQAEDDAVLDAFARQLRELLAEGDDEDLELAVEALGCFVQPTHLRLWLTWMAWRIETFEWKPAA